MKSSTTEFRQAARIFQALSHPVRLLLLQRLMEKECCVSEIERRLGISQPNVSQHLKVLKEAGLIAGRRDKTRVCYRVADERIERILKIFMGRKQKVMKPVEIRQKRRTAPPSVPRA